MVLAARFKRKAEIVAVVGHIEPAECSPQYLEVKPTRNHSRSLGRAFDHMDISQAKGVQLLDGVQVSPCRIAVEAGAVD